MNAFEVGDRVLWHHEEATKHAPGSVLRAEAVASIAQTAHPDACHGKVGVVEDVENAEGTWLRVAFENETRVLTIDELVRIAEPEIEAETEGEV